MTVHVPKPKSGRFTIQYLSGQGYFVVSPSDVRVSGPYHSKENALTNRDARQRQADAKARRGPRPCLCCGAVFESEGAHNRMCGPCRLRGDDTTSFSFINPRRRTG